MLMMWLRSILCGYGIVIALMGLYPPWQIEGKYLPLRPGRYGAIWSPPSYGGEISVTLDLARLSVQMIVATVVAGVLVALLAIPRGPKR